jgi:hypothetical protein
MIKTQAFIELLDLKLNTEIGTYGPGDVKPDVHLLNLLLEIDTNKVLIPGDEMEYVFDYDPLIKKIDQLAGMGKYNTQEYLMMKIACECATYSEIKSIEIGLRKTPVHNGSGSLGVNLRLNETATNGLRPHKKQSKPLALKLA